MSAFYNFFFAMIADMRRLRHTPKLFEAIYQSTVQQQSAPLYPVQIGLIDYYRTLKLSEKRIHNSLNHVLKEMQRIPQENDRVLPESVKLLIYHARRELIFSHYVYNAGSAYSSFQFPTLFGFFFERFPGIKNINQFLHCIKTSYPKHFHLIENNLFSGLPTITKSVELFSNNGTFLSKYKFIIYSFFKSMLLSSNNLTHTEIQHQLKKEHLNLMNFMQQLQSVTIHCLVHEDATIFDPSYKQYVLKAKDVTVLKNQKNNKTISYIESKITGQALNLEINARYLSFLTGMIRNDVIRDDILKQYHTAASNLNETMLSCILRIFQLKQQLAKRKGFSSIMEMEWDSSLLSAERLLHSFDDIQQLILKPCAERIKYVATESFKFNFLTMKKDIQHPIALNALSSNPNLSKIHYTDWVFLKHQNLGRQHETVVSQYLNSHTVIPKLVHFFGKLFHLNFQEVPSYFPGSFLFNLKQGGFDSKCFIYKITDPQQHHKALGYLYLFPYQSPSCIQQSLGIHYIQTPRCLCVFPGHYVCFGELTRPTVTSPTNFIGATHLRSLFHELGHAIQFILYYQDFPSNLHTPDVFIDLTETYSQLFEMFFQLHVTRHDLTEHYETKEKLPPSYVSAFQLNMSHLMMLCSKSQIEISILQDIDFLNLNADLFKKKLREIVESHVPYTLPSWWHPLADNETISWVSMFNSILTFPYVLGVLRASSLYMSLTGHKKMYRQNTYDNAAHHHNCHTRKESQIIYPYYLNNCGLNETMLQQLKYTFFTAELNYINNGVSKTKNMHSSLINRETLLTSYRLNSLRHDTQCNVDWESIPSAFRFDAFETTLWNTYKKNLINEHNQITNKNIVQMTEGQHCHLKKKKTLESSLMSAEIESKHSQMMLNDSNQFKSPWSQ